MTCWFSNLENCDLARRHRALISSASASDSPAQFSKSTFDTSTEGLSHHRAPIAAEPPLSLPHAFLALDSPSLEPQSLGCMDHLVGVPKTLLPTLYPTLASMARSPELG
ncbi:hypothetical protein H8959_001647 [Pygathrix nigripes]